MLFVVRLLLTLVFAFCVLQLDKKIHRCRNRILHEVAKTHKSSKKKRRSRKRRPNPPPRLDSSRSLRVPQLGRQFSDESDYQYDDVEERAFQYEEDFHGKRERGKHYFGDTLVRASRRSYR